MRILVADDHDLVRDTIAAYLDGSDVEEVRTVATLQDAVTMARSSGSFDLVLLDYNMPGMNGLEGLERMRAANEGRPVAILSGSATRDVATAALKAGAQGFIPKTLSARSLLTAARFMAAGEIYTPIEFMKSDSAEGQSPLTRREQEVLGGICEGKSNKEIARDLDLQEVTVKLHVKTLSRKLEARNRTHAAMIGRDRGLI
ncbi:response regulator [Mameliella sediminis]|uniref:response regulator n=1 Tax=Mameliella sediminis TaxID=2836866 RepID=UPI001C43C62D|nr:response regulator transcription factor [Mameliella sediminis]MBY6112889.1 response regulator transcription factor [Antarctobacter heliothermus]MBY6143763.1 response regulator transcription factor [Mameliella alba]MBV7394171.1 response regulator transcription factor [Mameliella sediminis]MBY6162417.1 response regulator transcription factor [Mameliella alba]MBY6170891.1 response regulator transcription factor [Mameliella alba]